MDDTSGWQNLETSVKAFRCLCMGGSRRVVWACVGPLGRHSAKLSDVLKGLMEHPNRYAREECLKLITVLCDTLRKQPSTMEIAIGRDTEEEVAALAAVEPKTKGNVLSALSTGTVSIKRLSENNMQEMSDVSSAVIEDDDMFSFSGPSRVGQSLGTRATILSGSSPSGVVEEEKIRQENIHSRISSRELPVLSPSLTVCSLMSRAIQGGLQDPWSQVRLVATHAATSFLKSLLTGQEIKDRDKLITTCDSTNAEVMHGKGTATDPANTLYVPLSRGKTRDEDQDWEHCCTKYTKNITLPKSMKFLLSCSSLKGERLFMLARLKDKYNLNEDFLPADELDFVEKRRQFIWRDSPAQQLRCFCSPLEVTLI